MAEFTMPSLGADMDEGSLSQWLVHPGDHVERGDVVAVVETAKSAIEVECFTTGTVDALLVDEGATVPVGTPLARISTAPAGEPPTTPLVRRLAQERHLDLATVHGSGPGGRVTRSDVKHAGAARASTDAAGSGATGRARPGSEAPPPPETAAPPQTAAPPGPGQAQTGAGPKRVSEPVKASPLARKLAGELGVDLAEVAGTGRSGTVRAQDVRHAAEGPRTHPTAVSSAAPDAAAARLATARLMSRSKREIPHFYLSTTVDMAAALDWMHTRNRDLPLSQRLIPAALTLKAAALAARTVPELNGHWVDDHFVPAEEVTLGVAVSLRGGGLLAPTIAQADTLSVPEVMAALKDIVARARGGRLRASQTADPSVTVTNLGDQGVEVVFGVVYPPQVALIGFGQIVERPVAVNGLLGVRSVLTATLSADHRAADGATGARLLTSLDRLLQQPEEL